MKPNYLLIIIFPLLLLSFGKAQNAADILRKSEDQRRGIKSSVAEMSMTIVRPNWTRTMSMKTWSKGDDYTLILVTAPARDKGSATLKREKEVWNWLPKIERTVKLPPSMMSQSWMGSDLTHDDLVREVSLVEDYEHQILGTETIKDRKCWKIELIPHEDVPIVWAKIILFIDQEDYLQMKTEYYDEDAALVNVFKATQIGQLGGRTLATRLELIPMEEEGHKTVLAYKSINFNQALKESFFSVQNMKRIR